MRFAGTAMKWTSISSRDCWQNVPTLSNLFLPHQTSLLRSAWSCESSMICRSHCQHKSCIVPIRWRMLRRFLSAVTSLKNRWRVLCPVPIPIIYFVFLCFASRIWKLSFLAKRVFISGWTIYAMWPSFSMRFSKIRLSNFAGNQFLTEANFYNPRTDHGLFLPQVFHLHSLRSEVIWHQLPISLGKLLDNWKNDMNSLLSQF
mgnify:FL=1